MKTTLLKQNLILGFVLLISTFALANDPKPNSSANLQTSTENSSVSTQNSQWSKKMVNFINPVLKIYSIDLNKDVYSEEEKVTLLQAVKDLRNTSHGLKFSFISFFSKKDPAIEAEYEQFKNNLAMAEKTMAFSTKQSTFYIRNAIGQCAACHSNGGKSTHLFELFKDTSLSQTEKGRLALAVRDYEASVQAFKSILLDPNLQNNYFKMNDVLVSYLNSALLAGYDKPKILADVKLVLAASKNKGTQTDLLDIIKDIETSKEMKNYNEAIAKFNTYSKDLFNFHKSMFTSLRVKNALHADLSKLSSKKEKAIAYEALGDIYSHFPEISIFMVPENYYEQCVRILPKTEIANGCFEKFKSKIILGYSGSMGSNVPEYEEVKIQALKKLTSM
jgi:tetratricopeptide (TPR) repeat protein